MKSIFISYNQAYYEEIVNVLEHAGDRGYTMWEDVKGRGTVDGEPHLGSHAWPTLNHAILAIVEDAHVSPILDELKALDTKTPGLGLRAFVWSIEQSL